MHHVRIAPSILAADFGRLTEEVQAVERASADLIHVDVMDGHFVPNLTLGPPVIAALRRATKLPLDVHLMIEEPERWIDAYAEAGADILHVHPEVCPHLHRVVQQIRHAGKQAAVVLNPATPLSVLDYVLEDLSMVLVMSVNPGFGGQSFIPSALGKIAALRRLIDERGLSSTVSISVDGGIKLDNAAAVVEAGATVLVSGSGIFATPDYTATIAELRARGQHALHNRASFRL
ncbi:MAG: ribulose-phosphate 3-epimerase [Myxococcales bacterium]|jgi:ribulose-phosphate 3-epimerase|nr:ribulose-phosphate 3-epimerase [Myxococcales bacterium]